MNFQRQIDTHKYLYLTKIFEPNDNQLRLTIEEAGSSGVEEDLSIYGHTFSDIQAIVSDDRHYAYDIFFSDYIAYSVRNESFAGNDNNEKFVGRLFCIYSKSAFLDYVSKSTFATAEYPGPFVHYGFNCLNHIVDVISLHSPDISISREGKKSK